MVVRRVRGLADAADAEADLPLDLVGDAGQVRAGEVLDRPVGANGRVAAGDVEADTHHAGLVLICRDAADRHDVALVPISHEGHPLRPPGHVPELGDGFLLVLAEDSGDAHAISLDKPFQDWISRYPKHTPYHSAESGASRQRSPRGRRIV